MVSQTSPNLVTLLAMQKLAMYLVPVSWERHQEKRRFGRRDLDLPELMKNWVNVFADDPAAPTPRSFEGTTSGGSRYEAGYFVRGGDIGSGGWRPSKSNDAWTRSGLRSTVARRRTGEA